MKRQAAAKRRAAALPAVAYRQAAMAAAVDAADRLMTPQAYVDPTDPARLPDGYRWSVRPRDANSDTLRYLPMQRAQSRDLVRTHPVATGALGTYLDRVIGTGLALVAEPDRAVLGWSEEQATEWKAGVQREFSLWSDSTDCDIRGEQTFYEKQRLVAGSRCESGDCFTILPDGKRTPTMPYALRLQVIEADRVANPGRVADSPEVTGGVRRDGYGRALAYHVLRYHPGNVLQASASPGIGDWVEAIGATSGRRRMLHHFQPSRPEQSRGVPWFAPIVALLRDLDRYTEAEIKAAVVSALFTVFIETDTGSPAPVFAGAPIGPTPGDVAMGPGAVVGLMRGEKASFAEPTRPNTAFEPFFGAVAMQIGMALGLPADVLLKRFNASYSASRAALLDAWMFLRTQRFWVARSFCQPVYETWLTEAVILGRVKAPGFFADPLVRWAYTRAAWHGDSQGSINPKDEVAAYLDAIDGGLMTHERAQWELFGTDWNLSFEQMVRERKMKTAAGLVPTPKPGAPAPGDGKPAPTNDKQGTDALAAVAASFAAIAAREPPAPVVNVAPAPVTVHAGDVHIAPPAVTVNAGDTSINVPDGLVQLEATVSPTPVTVEVAPAPVIVQSPRLQATRQVVTRDAAGEISSVTTSPIEET